ncbi:MAG: hypothetical protein HZA90_19445 [Verrucomicrobia bacterium]|nr:hypothetical protein [Verrucomicrobiota bacterium]
MKTLARISTVLAITLGGCFPLQATIVNFDDLTQNDYTPIPAGYGSADHVAVSYSSPAWTSHMIFWTSGYGDLSKVAFQAYTGSGIFGEITLTPDAGYRVTLNGFDMAAYVGSGQISTRSEEVIDILYGSFVRHLGPRDLSATFPLTHTHFAPEVTYAGPITIRIGNDWNIAIDNIEFTATPVPEPSTILAGAFALLPFGLSAVRFLRRRQKAFQPDRRAGQQSSQQRGLPGLARDSA